MSELILWFDQIGKDDIAVAGGKGANLGELTRAGISVPPGFVVSAEAYRRFLGHHDLKPEIAQLAGLDTSDREALARASNALQERIIAAPMLDDVASDIRAAFAQLAREPVAVRSSATAEDLPQASFAGQQRTLLNVTGADAVVEAVQACWASLFETQAIFYRAQGGFDHVDCAIAVPVQAMVQSERSGVMFTVNPVTGDAGQAIIEAAFGLGEAVVSGMVTPDTYIVDKTSLAIVEASVSEQERELVRGDGQGEEANAWRDVEPARRSERKLSDEQIGALARLALQIEKHYGVPQDIEWAIEGGDNYVLQARPITTLS